MSRVSVFHFLAPHDSAWASMGMRKWLISYWFSKVYITIIDRDISVCFPLFSRVSGRTAQIFNQNSGTRMEWLMLGTIEGPRKADGTVDKLSDEQADAVIDRFRDWPGKKRYIAL